jgi:peptidoglycan lytic transglycosylase
MVLRLCAAICGAAILFVYSSSAMAKPGPEGTSTAATRHDACAMGVTIVGTASMYDPSEPGYKEGGTQTASGELYDPIAWTAAIQIDLRETFGGVRYGKDYRPAYALVEVANKRAIIKINDVGPLKPGRVIDLNKQTMRYFDPTLQRGLVHSMKITLLPGDGWAPGPIDG